MKLRACLKMVKESRELSDWTIRFYDTGNFIEESWIAIPTTIKINALYDDWYKDCDYCPTNDEPVFGITIAQESLGRCYLIESNMYELTFEQLMMEIERVLYR